MIAVQFHFSCSSLSLGPLSGLLDTLIAHFDGWQIVTEGNYGMQTFADEFDDVAGSYGLKYTVHLPMSDINIASMNRAIRSASIGETAETMRRAAGLGIKTFVVHPGIHSVLSLHDRERAFLLAREGIRALASLSKSLGTELLVENMPSVSGSVASKPKEMKSLMAGSPVNLCLDVAHASLDSELGAFLSMHDSIRMLHLSDNDGHQDEHLQPGAGRVVNRETVALISKMNIPVVIEARSPAEAISGKEYVESLL